MTAAVPDLLRRAADLYGERTALVVEDRTGGLTELTFAELRTSVRQLAGWLAGRGVGAGTRVAVLLPNSVWWPLTWLACAELSAVCVPVNAQAQSADLAHQLADSGASLLVTDALSPVVAGSGATVLVLPAAPAELPGAGSPPTQALPSTLLSVQYTSGTTGPPKGCLLTHEYWVSIARQAEANRPGMRTDDVLLTAQPFSYIDPQWHLVATLLLGCRLVLLDAFHPSTFLRSVRRHRVTVFYCLGAMPVLLLRRPPDAEDNRSALRFVLCSGIPAPEHAELERRFGAPWFELYGSTEIGGAAIGVTEADHDNCVGTGTLGRPLAGFEVGIVDPAGDRIKAADAAGELVVRGATGMLGYWRADGVVVDPRQDGWFRTGDLVRRTADGRYSFEGRCKDVVRRAGENISAAEVEQVLSEHPAVDLVAVVAAADELRGEEVHAVVQARRRVDPEELARFCAERIARFKVPRYWSFRELPLTPSGKVAKDALRTSLGAPDHDRAAALVRVDG